jgi:hypothetical protein
MADVVTHARFKLDKDGLDRLKQMGVEVLTDLPSDDEMGLQEPQYGEQVLGNLTDEEFTIFVDIWRVQNEMTDIMKAITARKLHEAGDLVATSDSPQQFIESVQQNSHVVYQTADEAKRSFLLQAKLNFLKGLFYWQMGEKYDCHDYKLGVRSKRRFVRKERRY